MDSKSGNDATDEHKRRIFCEYPNDEEAEVKLKQAWIAKIGFNLLYHSIYKDSDNWFLFSKTRY